MTLPLKQPCSYAKALMWIVGLASSVGLIALGTIHWSVDKLDTEVETLAVEVQAQAVVDADRGRDVIWIKESLTRVELKLDRIPTTPAP